MERDALMELVTRWVTVANNDSQLLRSIGMMQCAQELFAAICEQDAKHDPSLIM